MISKQTNKVKKYFKKTSLLLNVNYKNCEMFMREKNE